MMMILFFILVSFFAEESFHEFKIGRYKVSANESDMTLFVRLDRHDFLEAVKAQSGCDDESIMDMCMTEYIVDHFKLTFDGESACFGYSNHVVKEEFVEITFKIGINPTGIASIQVFNDMLLEEWDRQENIVLFELNGKMRSFRLNKNRTKTEVVY